MPESVITGVERFTHDVTWRTSWDCVRVTTDDGLTGVGEWSDAGARELSGRYAASTMSGLVTGLGVEEALAAVAAEAERQCGDPALSRPERRLRLTVLGGLEAALCDVAAVRARVPLSHWYGGRPGDRFRCYANLNRALHRRTPAEFARVARAAVKAGFTAVKCAPFDFLVGSRRVRHGLTLAAAVREAIGDDVELKLDLHGHLQVKEIIAVATEIVALRPGWVEDAAHLDDIEGLRAVRDALGVPIAGGEFAATCDELEPALTAGVLDIVMPDVKHAGGPRRALTLARFAESAGAKVSLHNPTGPVSTAHSLAVSWQVPGCGPLELAVFEHDRRAEVVAPAEVVREGMLAARNTEAGLGFALSMEPIAAAGEVPRIEVAGV